MASVRDFYKVKLLAAKDLNGKPVTGIITQVYPDVNKGKDSDGSTKLVVELGEGEHRIQLNKTNALSLGKLLGDDYDTWIGRKVKVSVIDTSFSGKPCKGLKIEPTK